MLTFYSNFGNEYGPYGKTGQTSFSVEDTDSDEFVAFFGRAGSLLDSIGVYYIPGMVA